MTAKSQTLRRFEQGLPHFAGLDLALLLGAQEQLKQGELEGLGKLIGSLGAAGKLRTIRTLAAIWRATDAELKTIETEPQLLAQLEALAGDRPFSESFEDAMDFHLALFGSLGLTLASSGSPATAPKPGKGKKAGASPSAGSSPRP